MNLLRLSKWAHSDVWISLLWRLGNFGENFQLDLESTSCELWLLLVPGPWHVGSMLPRRIFGRSSPQESQIWAWWPAARRQSIQPIPNGEWWNHVARELFSQAYAWSHFAVDWIAACATQWPQSLYVQLEKCWSYTRFGPILHLIRPILHQKIDPSYNRFEPILHSILTYLTLDFDLSYPIFAVEIVGASLALHKIKRKCMDM